MHIHSYQATLNNGTIISADMPVGTALAWNSLHWAHTPNRLAANRVEWKEDGEIRLLEVELEIGLQAFTETMAFSEIDPLTITLEPEADSDILAYYYFKDWWTRPAFVSAFDCVPDQTAIVFYRRQERYHFLLALPGSTFRAHFTGAAEGSGCLNLVLSADGAGYTCIQETAMLEAIDTDPYRCMSKAMACAAKLYGIPLREEREFPGLFEKLGWCSWDAFYKEITEEGMLAKAAEIREKKLPFGWLLIDDGWQDYADERMRSYGSNPQKFPGSLSHCVQALKEACGIDQIGVWHAFSGYWCGIDPKGSLALEKPSLFLRSHQGKLLPKPECAGEFFGEWYRRLSGEGISFVKVDSQSSTRQHYRTNTPTGQTAAALHRGLDGAAEQYMKGNLINCMGMAMENVLQRPTSAISRNSDDFFPLEESSFREHLLENAYNSPWHNIIYYGDWDMFWSSHPYAGKHALLRALSGGPIYVSDRVGETSPEVLRPLCYEDGTILRAPQAALPTADCLLSDPEKSGYLKLQNACNGVGYLAAYSYADHEITVPMRLADISLLPQKPGTTYAVYCPTTHTGFVAACGCAWDCILPAEDYCLYQAAPIRNGIAILGRADKYLSSHAITAIEETPAGLTVTLKEAGPLLIYAQSRPRCITDSAPNETLLEAQETQTPGFYIINMAGIGIKENSAVLRLS